MIDLSMWRIVEGRTASEVADDKDCLMAISWSDADGLDDQALVIRWPAAVTAWLLVIVWAMARACT